MNLRNAEFNDLPSIMRLMQGIIADMRSYGSDQWDENYPTNQHFSKDVEEGSLFVLCESKQIFGFITINNEEPEAYKNAQWRRNDSCLVVHRLGIDLNQKNKGLGKQLILFADHYALTQGIYYLKTDTYSLNKHAPGLFLRNGYTETGLINMKSKPNPYRCFDKLL